MHNTSCSSENPLYRNIQDNQKNLNPSFMQSIFSSRTSKHPSRNPNNLNHFRPNQVTFSSKSLKAIGPQIWNCLPNEIKSADNLNSFKRMIKQWDGPSCATLVNIIIPCKFYPFKSKLLLVFSFVSIYFLSYVLSLVL